MCSWFNVNMVAERRSTVLGSLSGESVEHVVQRAKSPENEDVTTTEDTVECTADWSGDVAENARQCESHH